MKEKPNFRKSLDNAIRLAERKTGYKRPFVIRSHHLINFIGIHDGFMTYADKAANIRESVARSTRMGYARDVLGDTSATASGFEESAELFFEQFYKLPDDHPVKIVNGQKDGLCNGCANGAHCSTDRQLLGDVEYFNDRIFAIARRVGVDDKIKVIHAYVTTSESGSHKTMAAMTTAGVVRRLLDATVSVF